MNGEKKDDNQQKELQNIVPMEPKRVANYVHKAFIKPNNSAEEKEIEMPSPESHASLETMRCMYFDFKFIAILYQKLEVK